MTEHNYLRIMKRILDEGDYREGRNGGVYSLFGEQMRFDLSEGFPLLTTKRVHFKSVIVELLWFLRGDTNVQYLRDHGVTIWDEWADENGELGPVYGCQWRGWGTQEVEFVDLPTTRGLRMQHASIDQITNVIHSLKADPYSRRHVVSAWNVADLDDMALPPCHCLFQFHVSNGHLNCQLYQRSADWFLGVPFNIASYALLTHLIAREVGLEPGEFIHTFGDLHLYANHVEAARTQLERGCNDFPELFVNPGVSLFDLEPNNIGVYNYDPHPAIKAEVSA